VVDGKTCRECGEFKPLSEFYRAAEMRDGYRSECKACNLARRASRYREEPAIRARDLERVQRWRGENPEKYAELQRRTRARPSYRLGLRRSHLMRKYGITLEQYDAMLLAQGGGCAICGTPEPEGTSLHVDHHHDSGEVRGLLCFGCNAGIGQFREDRDLLLAAAEYLRSPRR